MASTVASGVSHLVCFFLTLSLCVAGESDAANSAFMTDDSVHPLENDYMKKDICPQIIDWIPLSEAITLEGDHVSVFQGAFGWGKQYFYSVGVYFTDSDVGTCAFQVRCDPACEGRPCMHMESGVKSRCETRYNLIPAITADEAAGDVAWKMIRVPGQCVCTQVVRDEAHSASENKANLLDISKLFHG